MMIYALLIVFLSLSSASGEHLDKDTLNTCRKCTHAGITWNCDRTVHCGSGQVCFYQEFLTGITPQYYSGCIDQKHCKDITTHIHKDQSGDHSVPDTHLEHLPKHPSHGMCCSTHSCNNPLPTKTIVTTKKPTTPTPTTTSTTTFTTTSEALVFNPQGVTYCRKCVADTSGVTCLHTERCSPNKDHACYFIEENEVGFPVTYKTGCIEKQYCASVETPIKTPVLNQRGKCCFNEFCNNESFYAKAVLASTTSTSTMAPTSASASATLTTSTTKTVPTSTTTATTTRVPTSTSNIPTTSTVTTVPTSTTSTTTTRVPTSTTPTTSTITTVPTSTTSTIAAQTTATPLTGKICTVCSDETCGSTVNYQCPETYPLCLTTVKDDNGVLVYEKRCASFTECAKRWLIESSLKPECTSLADNTTISTGLDCTFCCEVDGCNKDTVPPSETLIYKI